MIQLLGLIGVMIITVSRHLAALLAKIAPVVGGVVIVTSFQTNASGFMGELWRISMSVALGVFITLVGAIYQNLNRRIESLETAAKSDFVSRREYDATKDLMIKQLNRIEELLLRKSTR
jgi:hypothetical protein